MIPVYQTRFGGGDTPPAEQGNCWQAAVASVLDLPLDDAFDQTKHDWRDPVPWYDAWLKWLARYSLATVYVQGMGKVTTPYGYHLADVDSVTIPGGLHIVVVKDGEVVHDPNPHAETVGDIKGVHLFVPLDAGRLIWEARS